MSHNALHRGVTAAVLALACEPLYAHVLSAPGGGFASGAAHPFLGLDHLLAMVAVGLWAAQLGGRALWAAPLAFVGTLLVGALAGAAGLAFPLVEPGIAASLLVLGLLIATAVRLPTTAAAVIVGAFALFHGHAHGSEMLNAAAPLAYMVGFAATTVLLHATGMTLGTVARPRAASLLRLAGAAVAGAGVWLLVAI